MMFRRGSAFTLEKRLSRSVRTASIGAFALAVAGCSSSASTPAQSRDDGGPPSEDSGGRSVDSGVANAHDSGGIVAPDGSGDGASAGDGATPDGGVLAVPLSSCTPLVYTANVAIGGSQTFQMIVDTGSATLGVASSACTTCGVTPLYTPGATAVDQKMTATSDFGTGMWSGEVYQDSVGFASDPSVGVNLVAIDSQSSFFSPDPMCGSAAGEYQGVLGFDRPAAALAGTNVFFDQYVAAKGVPNAFATQLCDNGGTLWLGGYDPAFTTAAPQYTPFTSDIYSSYYYTVDLTTVTVGGTSVTIPSGSNSDSVLDTGTSVFLLSTAAFDALSAAIAATPGFQQVFGTSVGAAWFSSARAPSCTTLTQTKAELDATLPPLTLSFGMSPAIEVQAAATESYIWPYGGQWCSALLSAQAAGLSSFPLASIIGSPVLRSNLVIFDRANGRVGFAPHTPCKG
jgi:hypothetical protein